MFAAQRYIHPRFIDPAKIRETAVLIAKTVMEASYPISRIKGTIADLVKISRVSILLYGSQLIYHITVPLIDFVMYDLYKASPLPVPQNLSNDSSTYAYIWPSSRLFALSQTEDTYINI